jgi:hypothetical protein
VAVESGTIVALGRDFVSVRSATGSVVSYAGLTSAAKTYPAARRTPLALPGKRRLFAHPSRPGAGGPGVAHSHDELLPLPRLIDRPPLSRRDYVVRWLRVGSSIQAGTVLGRAAREPRPQARLARSPARPVAAEVG